MTYIRYIFNINQFDFQNNIMQNAIFIKEKTMKNIVILAKKIFAIYAVMTQGA